MRAGDHAAISASIRLRFACVVPPGTGCPSARKVAALPMCRSAMNNVRSAGHQSARSGSRTSEWPAQSTVQAGEEDEAREDTA